MSDGIDAITMPKWGLAMTEGMVAEWQMNVGDRFDRGDEIADIETAKITNALEATKPGLMRRIVVEPDEMVPVGTLLAVAAEPEVSDDTIAAFVTAFQENFVPPEIEESSGPVLEQVTLGDGRSLRYLRQGPGDGATVVMVHGFGGDLNSWMFNQPALAAQFDVIAVDLPGHGGSSKDVGAGDVAAMSAALEDFLDTMDITAPAHFVGHSLGGACALHLALTDAARVASATLICPAGLGPDINTGFISDFIEARRPRQLRPVLELLFHEPGLVSREMIDDVLKFKRLDGVPEALATIARAAFAGGEQRHVMAGDLGRLAVPAQAIWGETDQIVPPPDAAAELSGLTVHRLAETGHSAHMEAPGKVNTLITELVITASG